MSGVANVLFHTQCGKFQVWSISGVMDNGYLVWWISVWWMSYNLIEGMDCINNFPVVNAGDKIYYFEILLGLLLVFR